MKILAIDDDFTILRSLKNSFEKENWQVEAVSLYADAIQKINRESYDIIVCDYQLSAQKNEKHGLDIVHHMRENDIQTPILFLTGNRLEEVTPWEVLDSGVDDFLKKPYKSPELISRVKAIMRRNFDCKKNSTNTIVHDDITLSLDTRKVCIGGKNVHLGNTLFQLLMKFLQHPNNVLTYEDIIQYIWGGGNRFSLGESKNKLRVHMTYLKKKIGKKSSNHIVTIHGIGYMWESIQA